MAERLDLTGQRFGRLVVEARVEDRKKHKYWYCLCDCGVYTIVSHGNLRNGHTRSCGCLVRDTMGDVSRSHGLSKTPIYRHWAKMNYRCNNPSATQYRHYGGRGIQICERWQSFENFYADMGDSFKPGLTLDRIDNDGNYEPSNCRWADQQTQCRHRRNSRVLTVNGITACLTELAEYFGTNVQTARMRSVKGWSDEEIIFGRAK